MFATPFLDRLSLDHAADERAIKRAYARELKQIDLETDAAGFQVLRDAYEMALQWARDMQADDSVATDAPVPPAAAREQEMRARPAVPVAPARDADTGPSPAQLAQAVFEDFLAVCAEMAGQGDAGDSLLWRKHLQRCANDDRLLNIAARAHFEFFIASLLTDGWQVGHESLFVAARQVFGWDKDRRRLLEFGQRGAWLNQAIDECEMFTHQQSADCSGQTDAVTRIRQQDAPSKSELMTHAPHLRNMAACFPAWTAIIAARERLEQWIDMEQAIPAWRRRLRFTRPASSTATSGGYSWWKGMLIIIAIRALFAIFGPSSTPKAPPPWTAPRISQPSGNSTAQEKLAEELYQRAAGNLYMPPGTRKLDLMSQSLQQASPPPPPAPPKGRFLNDAEMKAISKRVQFEWAHTADRAYKVEFTVELDEHGAIAKLTKKTASGLPVLDRYVEEAIRASAPFGPQIRRRFGLFYSWRRGPAKAGGSARPGVATPES